MRLPLDYKENVPRSVRNLSLEKRTTFNAGVVIPILFQKIYPNDKFEIDFATLLQSNPLVAPLMGQYVLQTNFFFEPDSNLYGWLDNNSKLLSSEILAKKRFTFSQCIPSLSPDGGDYVAAQADYAVTRGSLLDYYGISPATFFTPGEDMVSFPSFTADRVLAYMDIIRNYYMPSQSVSALYVRENRSENSQLGAIGRDQFDNFFKFLRNQDDGFDLDNFPWSLDEYNMPDIGMFFEEMHKGGLFCVPYLPDMMRNLLLNIESSKINVEVQNGQFSIDTLRFKNKLQRLVDRYDISGGRFSNWLRTVWGTSGGKRLDIPQLIGSTSLTIDPSNITSTANTQSASGGDPIGQLAGNINQSNYKGKNKNKNFKFYFSSNEPGTLVCCVALIPKVDYSQGLSHDLTDTLFADDYKPQFAQLGYQDVHRGYYTSIPTVTSNGTTSSTVENPVDQVVGKQIAWLDLMSNVNRVHGEFAEGGYYQTWVLRRRYTHVTEWADEDRTIPKNSEYSMPSYYVDPRQYTYMFTNTNITEDNFFFQIAFDIRAVRPIGKRYMPTLE